MYIIIQIEVTSPTHTIKCLMNLNLKWQRKMIPLNKWRGGDEGESKLVMLSRSSMKGRTGPSYLDDPRDLDCVICGLPIVWVKTSKTQVREKFRICTSDGASRFLAAAQYLQDEVFCRVSDLETVDDVFAADLYCHAVCSRRYLRRYEDAVNEKDSAGGVPRSGSDVKKLLFVKAMENVELYLQKRYAFTMPEIRDYMSSFDEANDVLIYNRDVKKLLSDQ